MVNALAMAAAVLAVVLFGLALVSMSSGRPGVAGLCFLGASVAIYFREKRLLDD